MGEKSEGATAEYLKRFEEAKRELEKALEITRFQIIIEPISYASPRIPPKYIEMRVIVDTSIDAVSFVQTVPICHFESMFDILFKMAKTEIEKRVEEIKKKL